MTFEDQDEIAAIIQRVGPIVLGTVPARSSASTAELRRLVGVLMASGDVVQSTAAFAYQFTLCLDEARAQGATYLTMANVRLAALAEEPVSLSATILVQQMVRLSLAAEARLVAAVDFRSRDQASALAAQINAAFSDAAEVAADAMQADAYMAIVQLQGAVTKFFADTAMQLPRIVQLEFAEPMPTLTIAQKLYGDGSRADEVRDENSVVHPAFAPRTLRALAV